MNVALGPLLGWAYLMYLWGFLVCCSVYSYSSARMCISFFSRILI